MGRGRAAGFSLLEMAVVIALIGLLLGAILTPLATQFEVRKNRETERQLREIKQALLGFAITNGRLPCPDVFDPSNGDAQEVPSVADGLEDCTSSYGGSVQAFLPWRTLELRATDAWGGLFAYRVTEEFTRRAVGGASAGVGNGRLDIGDVGDISVQTRGDDPAQGAGGENKELVTLATTAPAVVLSHGANGLGGWTIDGDQHEDAALGTDEAENTDGDATFIVRLHSSGGFDCSEVDEARVFCEYDDLAIWLSRSVLIGELVNAGLLP